MDDKQKARSRDDRLSDLGRMSRAEVGLASKSHLPAPRSESVGDEHRFAAQRPRAEGDVERRSPFPLSACPTPTDISLSVEARRAQLGQTEGLEATFDDTQSGVNPLGFSSNDTQTVGQLKQPKSYVNTWSQRCRRVWERCVSKPQRRFGEEKKNKV